MVINLTKTSSGSTIEWIKYSVPRLCTVEVIDAANRNNVCNVTLVVANKGTEDSFTSLAGRQGCTIAQGATSFPSASLIFTGPLTLGAGEEAWALFYGTDSGDKLELNLKVAG